MASETGPVEASIWDQDHCVRLDLTEELEAATEQTGVRVSIESPPGGTWDRGRQLDFRLDKRGVRQLRLALQRFEKVVSDGE